MDPFFATAKKAVVGAALAFLGALSASWLSGHQLNWAEAISAAIAAAVTGFGVYTVTNRPAVNRRTDSGNVP